MKVHLFFKELHDKPSLTATDVRQSVVGSVRSTTVIMVVIIFHQKDFTQTIFSLILKIKYKGHTLIVLLEDQFFRRALEIHKFYY